MSDGVLDREDLIRLTKYSQKKKQCAWLARAGIWFEPDRDGYPSTTWYHVHHPLSLREVDKQSSELHTPNFGAINNGRKTKKSG